MSLISREVDDTEGRPPPMLLQNRKDIQSWVSETVGAASDSMFLAKAASARVANACANDAGRETARMVARLAKIAEGLYQATGVLQAQYMTRPNVLCTLYTTVLTPGATVAFSIQPGVGNSYYRLMGQICDDNQASVMGYTSLKIGGQEHVQFTQTTPTAPVTGACTWAVFALKESAGWANLAPWVGQVFNSNTPVLGTVANMTVAASGDAISVAARIMYLTQTDPCGFRYPEAVQSAAAYFNRIRNFSAGLMLGGGFSGQGYVGQDLTMQTIPH